MVDQYLHFNSKSQGAFRGEKRTYDPRPNTIDEPKNRGVILVQTTVKEKLDWFIEQASKYVDNVFAVEATNAVGVKAELIVRGETWGVFTSLELLRLKSLLENGSFHKMIETLPVRSDSELWSQTDAPEYKGREIWEGVKMEGVAKTTEKESYILPDPNIGKSKDYSPQPQLGIKNTPVELGDYSRQVFTGEISQRDRALMLERRDDLLVGVIEALKRCNEVEAEESALNAKRVFGFIFNG
jgi:hypothetical protein